MTRGRTAALWGWIALVVMAGAAVYLTAVRPLAGDEAVHWPWVLLLVAMFAAAERLGVHVRIGREAFAFTMSEVPLVLALFMLRPDLVVICRLAGGVIAQLMLRRPARKVVFNVGLFALETSVAVWVWYAVLAGHAPLEPRGWLATGLAVLVSGALSSGLISVAIAIATGERPRFLGEVVGFGQLADLANACFALTAAFVLGSDWRAFWLLFVMLGVFAVAYASYDRARLRSDRLEQLNRFTEVVGREIELEAVIRTILEEVRSAFEVRVVELRLSSAGDESVVWRHDGSTRRSTAVLHDSLDVPEGDCLLLPRGTRDVDLARRAADAKVRDAIVVPLRSEGRVLGSLAIADSLGDVSTFTKGDVAQLQALANHAAVAFDNASRAGRIIEQAQERALTALRDELTGLANRRLLGVWLDECLAAQRAGLVLLDLDRFREVNDSLGHEIGDVLLRRVGERLTETLPQGALLSRVGGDEFAVVLPGYDERAATTCAREILATLAEPFELEGLPVAVDASIGVALAVAGTDRTSLLRWADMAMYSAKDSRVGYEVYRPELDRSDSSRLGLLADLRQALACDGIGVAYQPKVDVGTGRIAGAEALVRWNHPTHGPIPPDGFVPLAEHSSLITPLTMVVLRRALRECATWRSLVGDFSVAVNISVRSLLEPDFVENVGRTLAASGVPTRAVTLEITETSLMADPERATQALHALRELGVRLSVDDLGTGYSSLSYLGSLPVDEIKIDKSFMREIADPRSDAIVTSVVELGRRLGHRVVAEGIEDRATYEALSRMGADTAQGFWLGRPMPPAELSRLLDSWEPVVVKGLRVVG